MTPPITLTTPTEALPDHPRRLSRLPPAVLALVAQSIGLGLALPLLWTLPVPAGWETPLFVGLQGLIAALCGRALGLAAWWTFINLAFVPAAVLCSGAGIGPGWFLAAFVSMVLLYWSTYRTQVPLYLTSAPGCRRVAEIVEREQSRRFVDLGSGSGGVLAHLARRFPELDCHGVELAPVPYWISRARLALRRNCRVQWKDFWSLDLSRYDVVYAFLSPVPMGELWAKVRREMRPGTLFISNSFPVMGVAPEEVVTVPGRIRRKLYLWRM